MGVSLPLLSFTPEEPHGQASGDRQAPVKGSRSSHAQDSLFSSGLSVSQMLLWQISLESAKMLWVRSFPRMLSDMKGNCPPQKSPLGLRGPF